LIRSGSYQDQNFCLCCILVDPCSYVLTGCNYVFSPFSFLLRLWGKYMLQNMVFVMHCFMEFKDMSVLKLQSVLTCNNNHLHASQLWENRLLSSHSLTSKKQKVPICVWKFGNIIYKIECTSLQSTDTARVFRHLTDTNVCKFFYTESRQTVQKCHN
jgi:hypothetical protein